MSAEDSKWWDVSWNPIRYLNGWMCTKISPGCANCYAEAINLRFGNLYHFRPEICESNWQLDEKILTKPLHWRKPRRIFIMDMGDLFHEQIPRNFIARVLDVAYKSYVNSGHVFLFLTKRPERMRDELALWSHLRGNNMAGLYGFWFGVTVENEKYLWRLNGLIQDVPAAYKFVSLEPLLEEVRIEDYLKDLSWVICGPETGPRRRLCKPEWIESVVEQCNAADVPVFVKAVPINGRISHDPAEWPVHLRRRGWPK